MTNDEIISLARSIIQGDDDPVNAVTGVENGCAMAVLVAYNLLCGDAAQIGIPDGPDRDEKLGRCKAIAEMLGAYHAKLRINGPDGCQYLDAFIPPDRPDIRQRIQDSLALIGGKICDLN